MYPKRISSSTLNHGSIHLDIISTKLIWLCILLITINNAPQCSCTAMHDRVEHNPIPNNIPFLWNNYMNLQQHHRSTRGLSMENLSSNQPSGSTFNITSLSPDQSSLVPQTLPFWESMVGSSSTNQEDVLDVHIRNILIPRVSGTPGNIQVRQYIVDTLKHFNYDVELDEFQTSTPVGRVGFANIIGTSNPKSCKQLVLACHYDSKMMDGFLGAIDSAVPCAMLLKMAETFKDSFRDTGDNSEEAKSNISLRFIFFDGEEAFVQWSATDSLYGSRHLAAKWSKQPAPTSCAQKRTELQRIELFVLLDLIGTSDTSFVMYNTRLRHHYESLQKYEKAHMMRSGLGQFQVRRDAAFRSRTLPLDFVEDDHVPFKQRGVPILSLLAHPFPRVWHTIDDNYSAIDFQRTRRILDVLEEFVANYSSSST